MYFKPFPDNGRWQGIGLIATLVILDVFLAAELIGRPVDGVSYLLVLITLGSLVAIGYIGFRTLGAWTMEYWIDRDAVTLVWGLTRQVVPLPRIQRVQVGGNAVPPRLSMPWHWPCPERRRYFADGLGIVNAYATRPLSEQVILVTDGESFSLSPSDPDRFLKAFQERYALGAARLVPVELQRPPLWTWPLWRDRAAMFLMIAGLLGVVVMFGLLCFRFPQLSSDLPLHFDVTGLPDRIAPKVDLFGLPMIGLVTWVFNTAMGVWLYRRVQRGAAYLLWGGALAVQTIAGLALVNLMRW